MSEGFEHLWYKHLSVIIILSLRSWNLLIFAFNCWSLFHSTSFFKWSYKEKSKGFHPLHHKEECVRLRLTGLGNKFVTIGINCKNSKLISLVRLA